MRRSAAPSQVGVVPKRPRFAPPFLSSSDIPGRPEAVTTKNASSFSERNAVQASAKNSVRSASDILSIIQSKASLENQPADYSHDFHESSISSPNIFNSTELELSSVGICDNSFEHLMTSESGHSAKRSSPLSSDVMVTKNIVHDKSNGKIQNDIVAARYLSVMWCKLSKKKHKTWEGDAVLIVRGRTAILVDMEGKEIGQGSGYKISQLQELSDGHMLVIGGKQIEVMGVLSEEQFKSGRCFTSTSSAAETEIEETSERHTAVVSKPFINPSKNTSQDQENISKPVKKVMSMLLPDVGDPNVVVMPRPSDSHQWQHNTDHQSVVDIIVDQHLSRHLRPHQRDGVIFLYQCVMGMKSHRGYGAVLADEMGLGKTLQCITLIWTLYKQGPYGGKPVLKRILIITPGSLVKNWAKEFKKWLSTERISVFAVLPDKKIEDFVNTPFCPVMIISYEMFVRNVEAIRQIRFDLLVCDEGHRLKNTNIKTTMFANSLSVKRRIVLTGTPVQNDLEELYSIVDFVNPGVLGTIGAFRHVYEDPILASRQRSATVEEMSLGQIRAAELNRVTSLFILRRTQEINNDYLPPKVDIVLFCCLTQLQASLYNKLVLSGAVKSCLSNSIIFDTSQHLCCISALKKLCNHPDLIYKSALENAAFDPFSESSDINKSLYDGLHCLYPEGYSEEHDKTLHSSKLNILSKLLQGFHRKSPAERVVVVSNYTKTLDIIEALCKNLGYHFVRLDGNTATNKRQEIVDRFNNHYSSDFVFLLSTKAGGVGLNLIGASRLVLYDIDWNPATDLQAMARVWRDGQRCRTYIYRLLSTDTIEEKMYQRQISKQGLSGIVVDAKTSDSKQTFSPEQLRELFAISDEKILCSTHDLLNCNCQGEREEEEDSMKKVGDTVSQGMIRQCQLQTNKLFKNNQKNMCMDELLEWTHIPGPNPDMTHVDPLFPVDDLSQVTFAFWTESNKQDNNT